MAKKITSALGKFSNSTVTGDDVTFKKDNVADFTVKKKPEGSFKVMKNLFWPLVAVVMLALVVLFIFINPFLGLGFLVFSILMLIALNFFVYRYFQVEYSYAIENSELIATEIYGQKSDKLLLHIKMSQVEAVAPYEGEYAAAADDATIKERIDLRSCATTSDAFYALYTKEDGTRGVMLFEACEKTLKAFKYYNSKNTVVRPTRY